MGSLISGEKPVYQAKSDDYYYYASQADTGINSFYSGTGANIAGMRT